MNRRRVNRLFRRGGWSLALLGVGLWLAPARLAAQAPASIFDEDPATLTAPPIPDRIEGFNRALFKVNDGLYKVTLRPISKVYGAVVPAPVRRGVGRFFHNLAYPTRLVGNLFEGKVGAAGTETARFVVNTVTSLGFVATADHFPKLKERPSDLGLAFGAWGMGHGTYVVLPLLGPSSLRDGVGLGLSGYFLDPVRYLQEWEYRAVGTGLEIVNASPDQMRAYDGLKAGSIDAYVALRDAYSAQRSRRTPPAAGQTPAASAVPAAAASTPPP